LHKHHAMEEILTGLLYVDRDACDLHVHMKTVDVPLNMLDERALCPGSQALEKINAMLR
jgi:2-oxoglutarate/2-oxoacid ferredoxin oxidoreductase subunit beta